MTWIAISASLSFVAKKLATANCITVGACWAVHIYMPPAGRSYQSQRTTCPGSAESSGQSRRSVNQGLSIPKHVMLTPAEGTCSPHSTGLRRE